MSSGRFEVKFATTKEELTAVYKLRYEDMILEYNDGKADDGSGLDINKYDEYAQHIIVKDSTNGTVCGYYRMITSEALVGERKFVCEEEFNIDALKATGEKICEYSRAVIKKEYRGGPLLLFLWKFILDYMEQNDVRFLVGDASFSGTDRTKFVNEISYLATTYPIADKWHITSRDTLPPMQMADLSQVDGNALLRSMPPLIRAYISFGCKIASQPFVDNEFGSVDVFILLDMQDCNQAYINKLRRLG